MAELTNTLPSLKRVAPDGQTWRAHLEAICGYWVDKDHLLWGGRAWRHLIPEAGTQPIISPRSAILHSNAGPRLTLWASLWRFWNRTDITGEAHLQIDGVNAVDDNGVTVLQSIPFNRRADCNAKANSWWFGSRRYGAISFETQDRGGDILETTPWSLPQLKAMIGVLTVLCVVYGISCDEPTTWDGSGIGHHNRFAEWSIYKGKTCPGAARIRQMAFIRQAVANNLAEFGAATGWKCGQVLA